MTVIREVLKKDCDEAWALVDQVGLKDRINEAINEGKEEDEAVSKYPRVFRNKGKSFDAIVSKVKETDLKVGKTDPAKVGERSIIGIPTLRVAHKWFRGIRIIKEVVFNFKTGIAEVPGYCNEEWTVMKALPGFFDPDG